jgi:hypothetical protein
MNLMRRYEQIELPPEVLENEEIRSLNLQIFGWTLDRQGSLITEGDCNPENPRNVLSYLDEGDDSVELQGESYH